MAVKLSTKTIIGIIIGIILFVVLIKLTFSLMKVLSPTLDSDTRINFERLVEKINSLSEEENLIYYVAGGKSLIGFNDKDFPEIERPPVEECVGKACLCICRGIKKDSCAEVFICESFDKLTIIKAPNGEQVKIKGRGIYDLSLNLVKENVLVIDVKEK